MRILLVRTSAIGDVLMASPVAKMLRETYPDAHIAWLVEPLSASFVRCNPYVDHPILMETPRWLQLLRAGKWGTAYREFQAFRQMLRAEKFDIAIDLQGLYKSALLTWLAHAPRRIGASNAREYTRPWLTETLPIHDGGSLSHGFVAFLAALGITPRPQQLVLEIPPDEREQAQRVIQQAGGQPGGYVACCATSSRTIKEWPWSRWGALATRLWHDEGLQTILIGGPERQQEADALARETGTCCVSAVGRTTLLQAAALVQAATAVVGCDTGLTYAGLATQTPTVALYGPTNPCWLRDEPCVHICHHALDCAPCRIRGTCTSYACMAAITVDEVVTAIRTQRSRQRIAEGIKA